MWAPRVKRLLYRRPTRTKSMGFWLKGTGFFFPRHNGRCQYNVRKHVVCLQIQNTANVEIHVVEVDPEIVLADSCKKIGQFERLCACRVVLAQHKFLPISSFHTLIVKFEARQPHPDQCQERRSKRRPK